MKKGMTKSQFINWKRFWFKRIPQCENFSCVHETSFCAIYPLCGCGSIYETYSKQDNPQECTNVGCIDCSQRWECKLKSDEERGIFRDEMWCPKEQKEMKFFEENCKCCRHPKCEVKNG